MPVASGAAAVSLPHVGSKVNGCASARCVLCLVKVKFRKSVAPIKRDNNSCMGKMVGDVRYATKRCRKSEYLRVR